MATYTIRGKSHRAQIRLRGVVESRSFRFKTQAISWATKREAEILSGSRTASRKTLGEAFQLYAETASTLKKGERWEVVRLTALQRHKIASKPLNLLTETHLAEWRDERLQSVSGASVRREMGLIRAVLEIARKEWKWIDRNPLTDVAKPPSPPARRRGVNPGEVEALRPYLASPAGLEIMRAFELAIETGMRAGEILSLTDSDIDLTNRVARLRVTKNGEPRDVSLSTKAVELLKAGPLKVSGPTMETMFRRARKEAAKELPSIATLHFHDSRSEAVSRLSKRLSILELKEQIGHRNIGSLNHYYRDSAADRAKKLD